MVGWVIESKGKEAYWGFVGGVGTTLLRAPVRKGGGEKPNAEGEKALEGSRETGAPDISVEMGKMVDSCGEW